jgi:hypothetical protein
MRKLLVIVTVGTFLLGLKGAWAQKEVKPPPVPPMLESPRPLEVPETKEPAAPAKPGEEAKTKKTDTAKKSLKKARAKKDGTKKKTAKAGKKKGQKAAKKTPPAAEPQPVPEEGPGEG